MATNLDLAGKVARNVELESVNLRYARLDVGCEPDEMPEEVDVDIQYRTAIGRRQSKFDPGAPELTVTVDFRFNVKKKSEELPVEVISFEAGYLLVYLLNPEAEIEDECFKHFSEVNGPYNAWPYWREIVQSVTGRVGMPGFIVPVFRPASVDV